MLSKPSNDAYDDFITTDWCRQAQDAMMVTYSRLKCSQTIQFFKDD